MTLALAAACTAALVAAVIQRITGLGFVLVLVGPIVLLYGPLEGVTLAEDVLALVEGADVLDQHVQFAQRRLVEALRQAGLGERARAAAHLVHQREPEVPG